VRTATKAEALASAQSYREAILASGELPPEGVRPVKGQTVSDLKAAADTPKPTGGTNAVPLIGVTRVIVD
jgi:hypothetical protein